MYMCVYVYVCITDIHVTVTGIISDMARLLSLLVTVIIGILFGKLANNLILTQCFIKYYIRK